MLKRIVKIGNGKFIGLDKATLKLARLDEQEFVRIDVRKNKITLSKPLLREISSKEYELMTRSKSSPAGKSP